MFVTVAGGMAGGWAITKAGAQLDKSVSEIKCFFILSLTSSSGIILGGLLGWCLQFYNLFKLGL